ncbi:MAG: efflux RND transporter periplasmic adaptor subunit [Devosia sp.]
MASLVILAAAAAAWIVFVPGATLTLASYGITLPFVAPAAEPASPGSGRPAGGAGGGRGGANRQTNVVTTPVTMASINTTLTAIGEGTAARSVTIAAPTGGNLAEVLVRPGQTVAAGDTIARLESDNEQITYDGAKLAADDASATLERTQGLANSNTVATTAVTAAQLAYDKAALDLRNAEVTLGRRTMTSPITGTVGLIKVTPGNYVTAQTPLTTIDDTSAILVDFWVPERYAPAISLDTPVSVSAIALPGKKFTGKVRAVDSRIDPASRTLQIQAEIPNADGALRAGMSLSVALNFPGEHYPTVNPLAILWSTDGSYVWKFVDGKAKRVPAEIVQRNSDGVLVRADLAPGEAIITEGILQLSDGAAVTLLSGPDGSTDQAATKP